MIRPATAVLTAGVLAGCSVAGPATSSLARAAVRVGFSAPTPGGVARVSALAGVTPAYVETFAGPGSAFPWAWAALAAKDHATLVIQLDTGSLSTAKVAGGAADGWLRSFAAAAAKWHGQLAIGIDHEFNGPWWPWSYEHQPAVSFTAAWRHIVTLFRGEGVHASWVWTISNVAGPQAAGLKPYWPGSSYVTWIGVNAYYYRASDTFGSVFTPVLAEARALSGDPVLVTETGANPASGRVRAIGDLFAGLASTPGVVGSIWFDYDKATDHDWYIDSDPAALAAFRAAVKTYG